jgi:hypothetical protein
MYLQLAGSPATISHVSLVSCPYKLPLIPSLPPLRPHPPTHPSRHFLLFSPHPCCVTHRNARNSIVSMRLLHDSLDTPGGGTLPSVPSQHKPFLSSLCSATLFPQPLPHSFPNYRECIPPYGSCSVGCGRPAHRSRRLPACAQPAIPCTIRVLNPIIKEGARCDD